MPVRIICVGNRLVREDCLGPLVHDVLRARTLPPGVELVDGGLQGINLVPLVEGASRVVFVDALAGFAPPGEVVSLTREDALDGSAASFGHSGGLAFLLRALAIACDERPPPYVLVGAEGALDDDLVSRVAARALDLASGAPP